MRSFFTQRLDKRFDCINTQLDDKNYLLGEQFTVADCYLFIVASWAPIFNYDLSRYQNVLFWQARVGERDTVKQVMATSSRQQ